MIGVLKVLKEQLTNISLAMRVGGFENKSKNGSNYLGSLWDIFSPLLQIVVYWFVFTSIMQRTDIKTENGQVIEYIHWLLVGFVVWLFFFKSTIDASSSIYSRMTVIKKIEFPMAAVPTIPIMNNFKIHLKLLVVAYGIIVLVGGYMPTIKMVQLVYIVPLTLLFLFGFGLITSTISTIIRDFHQLLSALMKIGLYISPVLWQVSIVGGQLGEILKYNPVHYFIEVYRAAIFGTSWYPLEHISETVFVLVLTFVIYIVGAVLHGKLKKNFAEFS